jgi:two-component sensor histidine kinase
MAPYPLIFPAVLFGTLASGLPGGLVALVIGMAASDYLFVTPRFTFRPENLTHGLSLTVTGIALLIVLWLAARYRNTMSLRAHEREEAENHLRFLLREVDHRANNLLAVVQSIVKLTKADDGELLRRTLLGRISALGHAHQLLAASRWRGADLATLVGQELRPYALGDAGRVSIRGPSMPLSSGEAEALAMAIHELATNAAKYGAFSTPGGMVAVTWDRDHSGARHIRWQEDGGPAVVTPDRKGFGARVLEQALAAVPGGRTALVWRPEGLICEFDLAPQGQKELRAPADEEKARLDADLRGGSQELYGP